MVKKVKEDKVDVNTPEWIADFEMKNSILGSLFKETSAIDIYEKMFKDMTVERPLFIGDLEKPKIAKNYDDIQKHIEEYNTVFVYLQEFRKSYSRKHISIDSIYGFIVDIDSVRSHNIQEIIDLIKVAPLKPNIVVSSGNGLHLYYLFDKVFQFYNYTYSIALYSYMANIVANRRSVFKVVKDVYKEVCGWYEKKGSSYIVDKLHLSQPLRMCGAKTKNSLYRTQGFVVSDHRVILEDLADMVEVEFIDDEVLSLMMDAEAHRTAEIILDDSGNTVTEELLGGGDVLGIGDDDAVDTVIVGKKENDFMAEYRKDPKGWWDGMASSVLEEYKRQQEENHLYAAALPVKPKKESKSNYDIYYETVRRIRKGATIGHRQRLLHVLSSRGSMHQIPIEQVTKDVNDLAEYFTSENPTLPMTDSDISSALHGYEQRWRYTNAFVLSDTGVDLQVENKEFTRRENNRKTKAAKIRKILAIAAFVFDENPKTSFRQLWGILKEDYSIHVARGWVTEREEIRDMKAKCMLALAQ